MTGHLSLSEAMTFYGVSEKTIRRWIKQGKLKAHKQEGRWHIESNDRTPGQNDRSDDRMLSPEALIEQLQTENAHLRDQVTALTEQTAALTKTLDQSQQLLAVQTQTTQQLTDQLSSSRQLIADMQSRSTVWQRLKAVFASA
jgi:predicted site-specific integrase-resolvase